MEKLDTIILENTNVITPDYSDLTSQQLDGTGVFDILMKTAKLHLQDEYDNGRISGKEYATVYLETIKSVLADSIQYLVNSEQVNKLQAETALVRQQTVTELSQTDDTVPLNLGFNGTADVEGLVKNKKDLTASQISLTNTQIEDAAAAKALTGQKIITELAQTGKDFTNAKAVGYGYNTSNTVDSLINAKIEAQAKENELIEQKIVTELAQTSDTKPSTLGEVLSTDITGIIALEKDKITIENSRIATDEKLIKQKTVTELSQTSNVIPVDLGYNANTAITGIIALEKDKITEDSARITAEKVLLEQKTVTELAQTSTTKPVDLGVMGTTNITGIVSYEMTKLIDESNKLIAEQQLLNQKSVTEVAQTSTIKPVDLGFITGTTDITGIVASQKALYDAQTDGYSRDAEQKIMKMMMDAWTVSASQSTATANDANHLNDNALGAVIQKAATGIGIASLPTGPATS